MFLWEILPLGKRLRSRRNVDKRILENQGNAWEKTHRQWREKERRYTSRDVSHAIAVIKERTKEKHHRGIFLWRFCLHYEISHIIYVSTAHTIRNHLHHRIIHHDATDAFHLHYLHISLSNYHHWCGYIFVSLSCLSLFPRVYIRVSCMRNVPRSLKKLNKD